MTGRQRLATHFAAADLLLIACLLAALCALAWHYGWLNDDALNYLSLGARIADGEHIGLRPSWGDKYWAVFPVGYPAIIGLFAQFLPDAFTASKVANATLTFGSILIAAHWLRLPLLVVAPLFFGATMLEIISYSWSENLFIFAHILALAALDAYMRRGTKTALFLFVVGLLLASSSRYIGGFTLLGYLPILTLYLTAQTRPRVLAAGMATGLVGLCFGGYLYFNLLHTGFPTGMQRMPAPESLLELAARFGTQFLIGSALLVPPILVMLTSRARPARFDWLRYRQALPPFFLGVFYLGVLFVLRSHSRFEDFSGRLLSPGLVLLWLSFLHMAWDAWRPRLAPAALARHILILTFAINLAVIYHEMLAKPSLITSQSADRAFAAYDRHYEGLPDGTVIISAGYNNPQVGWKVLSPIFGSDRLMYLVNDNYPLPLAEYQAYLGKLRYKDGPPTRYVFDFTEFSSLAEFERMLARRSGNPEVAEWIKSYFSPNSWVECTQCKPQTDKP